MAILFPINHLNGLILLIMTDKFLKNVNGARNWQECACW